MLVFVGNDTATILKSIDELVYLFSLGCHLVEFLLEDVKEEEDYLYLVLYFLHIFGGHFEIYLLQKWADSFS